MSDIVLVVAITAAAAAASPSVVASAIIFLLLVLLLPVVFVRLLFLSVRYVERSNIELQLFDVQSQRRATKRKMFMPPEGRMMLDLNSVWAKLEQVEHEREMVLRDELMRQEKLEQLAAKFVRKVSAADRVSECGGRGMWRPCVCVCVFYCLISW